MDALERLPRGEAKICGDRTMSPEDICKTEWYQNLQADRQSLTELGYQIVELAGHINAAHYRFLMLIAEWDRRKGWNDGASQSCAHWLTGSAAST
jgi:hypothetical protein